MTVSFTEKVKAYQKAKSRIPGLSFKDWEKMVAEQDSAVSAISESKRKKNTDLVPPVETEIPKIEAPPDISSKEEKTGFNREKFKDYEPLFSLKNVFNDPDKMSATSPKASMGEAMRETDAEFEEVYPWLNDKVEWFSQFGGEFLERIAPNLGETVTQENVGVLNKKRTEFDAISLKDLLMKGAEYNPFDQKQYKSVGPIFGHTMAGIGEAFGAYTEAEKIESETPIENFARFAGSTAVYVTTLPALYGVAGALVSRWGLTGRMIPAINRAIDSFSKTKEISSALKEPISKVLNFIRLRGKPSEYAVSPLREEALAAHWAEVNTLVGGVFEYSRELVNYLTGPEEQEFDFVMPAFLSLFYLATTPIEKYFSKKQMLEATKTLKEKVEVAIIEPLFELKHLSVKEYKEWMKAAPGDFAELLYKSQSVLENFMGKRAFHERSLSVIDELARAQAISHNVHSALQQISAVEWDKNGNKIMKEIASFTGKGKEAQRETADVLIGEVNEAFKISQSNPGLRALREKMYNKPWEVYADPSKFRKELDEVLELGSVKQVVSEGLEEVAKASTFIRREVTSEEIVAKAAAFREAKEGKSVKKTKMSGRSIKEIELNSHIEFLKTPIKQGIPAIRIGDNLFQGEIGQTLNQVDKTYSSEIRSLYDIEQMRIATKSSKNKMKIEYGMINKDEHFVNLKTGEVTERTARPVIDKLVKDNPDIDFTDILSKITKDTSWGLDRVLKNIKGRIIRKRLPISNGKNESPINEERMKYLMSQTDDYLGENAQKISDYYMGSLYKKRLEKPLLKTLLTGEMTEKEVVELQAKHPQEFLKWYKENPSTVNKLQGKELTEKVAIKRDFKDKEADRLADGVSDVIPESPMTDPQLLLIQEKPAVRIQKILDQFTDYTERFAEEKRLSTIKKGTDKIKPMQDREPLEMSQLVKPKISFNRDNLGIVSHNNVNVKSELEMVQDFKTIGLGTIDEKQLAKTLYSDEVIELPQNVARFLNEVSKKLPLGENNDHIIARVKNLNRLLDSGGLSSADQKKALETLSLLPFLRKIQRGQYKIKGTDIHAADFLPAVAGIPFGMEYTSNGNFVFTGLIDPDNPDHDPDLGKTLIYGGAAAILLFAAGKGGRKGKGLRGKKGKGITSGVKGVSKGKVEKIIRSIKDIPEEELASLSARNMEISKIEGMLLSEKQKAAMRWAEEPGHLKVGESVDFNPPYLSPEDLTPEAEAMLREAQLADVYPVGELTRIFEEYGKYTALAANHPLLALDRLGNFQIKLEADKWNVLAKYLYPAWHLSKIHPEVGKMLMLSKAYENEEHKWLDMFKKSNPNLFRLIPKNPKLGEQFDSIVRKYKWNKMTATEMTKLRATGEDGVIMADALDEATNSFKKFLDYRISIAEKRVKDFPGTGGEEFVKVLKSIRDNKGFNYIPEIRGEGKYAAIVYKITREERIDGMAIEKTGGMRSPDPSSDIVYHRYFNSIKEAEEAMNHSETMGKILEYLENKTGKKFSSSELELEKIVYTVDDNMKRVSADPVAGLYEIRRELHSRIRKSSEGLLEYGNPKKQLEIHIKNKKDLEIFEENFIRLFDPAMQVSKRLQSLSKAGLKNKQQHIPGYNDENYLNVILGKFRNTISNVLKEEKVMLQDKELMQLIEKGHHEAADYMSNIHLPFDRNGIENKGVAKWVSGFRTFAMIQQLSSNLSSPIVNTTALYTFIPHQLKLRSELLGNKISMAKTMYIMRQAKNDIKKLGPEIGPDGSFINKYADEWGNILWHKVEFLSKEEQAAFAWMDSRGQLGQNVAADFSTVLGNATAWGNETRMQKIQRGAFLAFSRSEKYVRRSTLLAYIRMLQDVRKVTGNKMSLIEMIERADVFNMDVNIPFGPWNRAAIGKKWGGVGTVPYTFMSFPINVGLTMAENSPIQAVHRDAIHMESRYPGIKAIATTIASMGALGGAYSIPGLSYIDRAHATGKLDFLSQMPNRPEEIAENMPMGTKGALGRAFHATEFDKFTPHTGPYSTGGGLRLSDKFVKEWQDILLTTSKFIHSLLFEGGDDTGLGEASQEVAKYGFMSYLGDQVLREDDAEKIAHITKQGLRYGATGVLGAIGETFAGKEGTNLLGWLPLITWSIAFNFYDKFTDLFGQPTGNAIETVKWIDMLTHRVTEIAQNPIREFGPVGVLKSVDVLAQVPFNIRSLKKSLEVMDEYMVRYPKGVRPSRKGTPKENIWNMPQHRYFFGHWSNVLAAGMAAVGLNTYEREGIRVEEDITRDIETYRKEVRGDLLRNIVSQSIYDPYGRDIASLEDLLETQGIYNTRIATISDMMEVDLSSLLITSENIEDGIANALADHKKNTHEMQAQLGFSVEGEDITEGKLELETKEMKRRNDITEKREKFKDSEERKRIIKEQEIKTQELLEKAKEEYEILTERFPWMKKENKKKGTKL